MKRPSVYSIMKRAVGVEVDHYYSNTSKHHIRHKLYGVHNTRKKVDAAVRKIRRDLKAAGYTVIYVERVYPPHRGQLVGLEYRASINAYIAKDD